MDFLLIFGALLALMLMGMWVQLAIALSAILYLVVDGGLSGLKALGLVSWGAAESFTLTAIPMFTLMAEVLLESGLGDRVYRGMSRVVRALPGGLLQTNIAACAVFAAVCGGSAPTAAAIGTVALPQLGHRGYDRKLSAGSLAAGATLGILIPPSITMIIYGTFTDTSVARLFMAGIVPGIVLALFYMVYIAIRAAIDPTVAPRESEPMMRGELAGVLLDILPFICLIGAVMGSIYLGLATPTEAGATGAFMALVIARVWGRPDFSVFRAALNKTVRLSGSILFVVFAAMLFAYATARAGVGETLVEWLAELNLTKVEFIILVFVLYSVLGCFMEGLGMMVITVPLLFPVLRALEIDPVWFGVMVVILIELGQLTPPLGVILFVVRAIWPSGTLEEVIVGVLPFYLLILLALACFVAFPQLVLWLPSHMFAQ